MVKRLALVGVVVLVAGCSGSKSVLDEGVRPGASGKTHVIDSTEALRAGRTTLSHWKLELQSGARQNPGKRFPNLSPDELRARLSAAADRYGFEVVSLDLLQPRQLAPKVIVRTKDYLRLAHATSAILSQIDPKRRTADDRTGWLFEGFYFRAEDEHGVPFLVAYTNMRGSSPGGGQWARSERLYPFGHG